MQNKRFNIGLDGRFLYSKSFGGIQRYTLTLFDKISKLHNVFIFYPSSRPPHPEFLERIRGEKVRCYAPKVKLWEQLFLPYYLSKTKVEIFHTPCESGVPVAKTRAKKIFTVHGLPDLSLRYFNPTPRNIIDLLIFYISLLSCDVCITVSEFSKREISRFFPVVGKKIRVIPDIVDAVFFETKSNSDNTILSRFKLYGKKYIMYVGNTEKHKNTVTLFKVFSKVREERKDIHTVAVLRGPSESEMNNLKRAYSDTIFLSNLTDRELSVLYRNAFLYVSMSLHEGFGLPVAESMACGTPAVLSNCGAMPEIASDAAEYVSPYDVEGAVKKIIELSEKEKKRLEMSRRARKRARIFSAESVIPKMLALYDELLL